MNCCFLSILYYFGEFYKNINVAFSILLTNLIDMSGNTFSKHVSENYK